jgi:Cellulase (glycosyl hydrolase family 5)
MLRKYLDRDTFTRRLAVIAGVVLVLFAVVGGGSAITRAAPRPARAPTSATGLRVVGNRLVFGPRRGKIVRLRGVSRSGLEYRCIEGAGFFESPHPYRIDTRAMIRVMLSWDINVVRVPLNEDCWLGFNTRPGLGAAPYRRIVAKYVHALNAAGLFVILDLHWAAPGSYRADKQDPMADAEHAPAFWSSVARTFRKDHELIFDLYNEPFGIDWPCWRDGCYSAPYSNYPGYQTAGMQQLVDAVRSTGATQPLMLGGIAAALDMSQWLDYEPADPLHQLIASEHTYGGQSPCDSSCLAAVAATAREVPVVFGEMGEMDCADDYVDPLMRFADSHWIGYLAWAWDGRPGWGCKGGPSLIVNYTGTATRYGAGYRAHLRALGVPVRP